MVGEIFAGGDAVDGRRRARAGAGSLIVAAAVTLLGIAAPSAEARGGSVDFGDAPDGAKARYLSKPKVVGRFPSKLASVGPRHTGLGTLKLGPRVDGEKDSHQVDRDIDDGVDLSAPKACKTAKLTTVLTGGKGVAAGKVVYVNAWFDWNRDGDWADPSDGCAPEWGVRNLPVPASSVGTLKLLPITLRAGKQVRELWYRVSVTLDEVQIDPSGRGRSVPYATGETEDYLLQPPRGKLIINPPPPEEEKEKEKEEKEKEEKKNGKFSVRCAPGVRVIPHGASATFGFILSDKGKGHIYGKFLGGRRGGGFNINVLRAGNQRGVPRGFVRSRSFRFKSTDVDPPNRVQVKRIRVSFTRGKMTRRATCTAIVVHTGKSAKKRKRGKRKDKHVKPPKIPVSKCTGGCGGQVATAPPPKGTTKVEHKVEPGGKVKLKITTAGPLEGFTIPLFPPNPTPLDPPLVTGDGPIECEIVPLELSGGAAALRCDLPGGSFKVDSFFDIDYRIEIGDVPAIQGTLNNSVGLPLEGFTAAPGTLQPPPPLVGAGGALFPGPTPDTVGFGVKIDAQNIALNQFAIQLPTSQEILGGNASGFACTPVGASNAVLACNGPVTSGAPIDGLLQLAAPRPSVLPAELLASPGDGQIFGPFGIGQNPANATGNGVFGLAVGNQFAFTLNLNSFGHLNEFLIDFPPGIQVVSGTATTFAGAFTCGPAETTEANNGLACVGAEIVNGEKIDGSVTLTTPALPPGSVFTAQGPATGVEGPFGFGGP